VSDDSGFHLHSEQLLSHHLHYETQEDGSVKARPCDRTDCDKGKPLAGTMAEVFASVKR